MTAPSDANVMPIRLSERAQAPRVLRLHADDNLIVSIDPILPGAVAEGVTAISRVPKGHKMATKADRRGGAGPEIRADHRLRQGADPARRAYP